VPIFNIALEELDYKTVCKRKSRVKVYRIVRSRKEG